MLAQNVLRRGLAANAVMALEDDCRVPVQPEKVVVRLLAEEARASDHGDGAFFLPTDIDELEREAAVQQGSELGRRDGGHHAGEQTWRRMSSSSSALPVPITTELSGSSARNTGRPVSSRSSASRPFKSAPPPASTMPRSAIRRAGRRSAPGQEAPRRGAGRATAGAIGR